MIQPSSLAVGSYFKRLAGSPYGAAGSIQRVENIDSEGVNRWQDMGAGGITRFDQMIPIELTELRELPLLKYFRGQFITIRDAEVFLHMGEYEEELTEIKCVHQLQNILRALEQMDIVLQ